MLITRFGPEEERAHHRKSSYRATAPNSDVRSLGLTTGHANSPRRDSVSSENRAALIPAMSNTVKHFILPQTAGRWPGFLFLPPDCHTFDEIARDRVVWLEVSLVARFEVEDESRMLAGAC